MPDMSETSCLSPQPDTRIYRNEGVAGTHIYAPKGIISHGLLALSAITAQPFLSP